jgi:hypothetical protein
MRDFPKGMVTAPFALRHSQKRLFSLLTGTTVNRRQIPSQKLIFFLQKKSRRYLPALFRL